MTRVLVLEDEAILAKNIARSLRLNGFEVVAVANCADARKALNGGGMDALCLDISLPDGNGLDLLEEVSEIAPILPTIVISGVVTPEVRSRAKRIGVREFLGKPFSMARLKALLVQITGPAVAKQAPADSPSGDSLQRR